MGFPGREQGRDWGYFGSSTGLFQCPNAAGARYELGNLELGSDPQSCAGGVPGLYEETKHIMINYPRAKVPGQLGFIGVQSVPVGFYTPMEGYPWRRIWRCGGVECPEPSFYQPNLY